jgi:alanine-glyoxylate transaminase/serine-glyoxylate transaminase/serine-pyruvate transaminase
MNLPAVRIPGRRLLHSPGPTPLPDEVLHALMAQPMDLADERLDATIAACESGLLRMLDAPPDARVMMYAANGHGVWEAVVQNLVPADGAVLIPGTGHFSASWAVQTEALGRRVVQTPWHEGQPIDPQAILDALREDRAGQIAAVFVVHTDTASSVTSDLQAIRAAMDASGHGALLVVDGVASFGAAPFSMKDLRCDVALGASQKALMCPPGVGFTAVSAAALAQAAANTSARFYWDWAQRDSPLSYRKFCGTAPQNLLAAMEAALGLIAREGLPAVLARHQLLARAVQAAVEGWRTAGALDFFAAQPASRSVSVTTVTVPAGTDVDGLRRVARERFQVAMAGGLGPLQGRAFRIGHLGDQNPAQIMGALGGIEAALRVCRIPMGRDGLARAADVLAEDPAG